MFVTILVIKPYQRVNLLARLCSINTAYTETLSQIGSSLSSSGDILSESNKESRADKF